MNVIIGCTKKKQAYPCTVEEMYSASDIFRMFVKYAKDVLKADHIYVVSAKYHVLTLDEVIEPYDKFILDMPAEDRNVFREQLFYDLINKGVDFDDHTVFLIGKHYIKDIVDYFIDYEWPTKHFQFGECKQWLKKQLEDYEKYKEM